MMRYGIQRLPKPPRILLQEHLPFDAHNRSIWTSTPIQTRIRSFRFPIVLSSRSVSQGRAYGYIPSRNDGRVDEDSRYRYQAKRAGTGVGAGRWMSSLATHGVSKHDDDQGKNGNEASTEALVQASNAEKQNGENDEDAEGEGDSYYDADGNDDVQDEELGEEHEYEQGQPDEFRKIRAGSYRDMVNRLSQVDTVLSKRTKHMIKTMVRKHVFAREDFKEKQEEMDNFFQELKERGKDKEKEKGKGNDKDKERNKGVELKTPYDTMLGCLVYMVSRSPNSIAAVKHVLQQIRAKDSKFKPLNVLDFGAGPALATIATQDFFEDSVKTAVLIEKQPFMKEIGSGMIDSVRTKTLSEVNLPKDVKQRISRELNRINDMRAEKTRGPKHVSRVRTGLWTELRDSIAAAEILQDNHVLRDPSVREAPKNAFRFTDTESSMSDEGLDSEGATVNAKGIKLFDLRSLWLTDVSDIPKDIQFDLVIANYSLGEISSVSELEQVLSGLIRHTKKYLVLIEPGHGYGFSYIRLSRDYAIKAGMNVVAPCLHNLKCPAGGTTQFCHFIQRFDMPSFQKKARPPFLANLGYEDERLSYVVLEKVSEALEKSNESSIKTGSERREVVPGEHADEAEQSPRPWGRLLRSPIKSRGHIIIDACTSHGTLERNVWSRSCGDRDDYRRARKLLWGDVWVKEPLFSPKMPGYIRENPEVKKQRELEEEKASKRVSNKLRRDEQDDE